MMNELTFHCKLFSRSKLCRFCAYSLLACWGQVSGISLASSPAILKLDRSVSSSSISILAILSVAARLRMFICSAT